MEKYQKLIEKTLGYWEKKANCAKSTVCGTLSFYGNETLCDPFYKAMIPMGGGFGEGLVCGAVVGSLAAISLILAEKGLIEKEIMNHVNTWKCNFKGKYGSLTCFDLIAEFKDAEGEIDYEMPGRREKCTDIVTSSVIFLGKIIDASMEK